MLGILLVRVSLWKVICEMLNLLMKVCGWLFME